SSRRRHTRFSRDWSSDVCSSDLNEDDNQRETCKTDIGHAAEFGAVAVSAHGPPRCNWHQRQTDCSDDNAGDERWKEARDAREYRSEERRVGKECRGRWWG